MVSKSQKQQTPTPSSSIGERAEECPSLRGASRLGRAEVLRRRSRRLHQLASIYRRHYWCLLEELRVKHRDYHWHYGKSPLQSVITAAADDDSRLNCAFSGSGCKSKAMPLTVFCHAHILADPKQTLYKPCNFQIKRSPQGQGPPILCGKPVLKAANPSFCRAHHQRSHKQISQALKKAGLPPSSSNKPLPKFSLFISQAVRHVQIKRQSQPQPQPQPQSSYCSKDDKTDQQDLG